MNSRSLFLHSQRLMAVVENAVSSLNDAQELIEHLTRLGERHLAMSVTEKHLKVGKPFCRHGDRNDLEKQAAIEQYLLVVLLVLLSRLTFKPLRR